MSSRRRSRSRSRDKKNAAAKLRMDTKPQTLRITDPSNPVGRRKEIDNVMKKARAQKSPTSEAIWNKRLLEVEAKDPNRWTHSGYKSLYIDGKTSPLPNRRSRSRSFTRRAARSPESPSSRRRSPMGGRRSPVRARSPPPRRSNIRSPSSNYRSPVRARSPPTRGRPRSPPPRRMQPSPSSTRRRSPSGSSVSSCSDESCSVCSPKTRRPRSPRSRSFSPPPRTSAGSSRKHMKRPPSPKTPARRRPPSPSPSPPPRRMPRPMTPPVAKKMPKMSSSDRPTDPRRQPPPPRPRASTGEVISIKGVKPNQKPGQSKTVKIKQEGARQKPTAIERAEVGDSSGSDEPPAPVVVPIVATTGIMLSERFGKIAQWSADRERRDMENMRITKTGTNMKVMVEEEDYLYGTPPRRYSLSPGPAGRFPEELLASGPSSLASWDDVRVRYQYYKDLGYLRDLSIDDYMKWEEWWYKYQDWLANERHYEHWLATQGTGGGGRRRRKKPVQSRLN